MCDRVAIIHRGRTLAAGPVEELLSRTGAGHRIVARPAEKAAVVLAAMLPEKVETDGDGALLLPAGASVPDVVRELVAAGVDVLAVERRAPTLEEFFLEVTGGETV
jgi:ABC-2 type transport system ATP-binding protein